MAVTIRFGADHDADKLELNFQNITGPNKGYVMEFNDLLCAAVKANCTLSVFNNTGGSQLINGSWVGLLGGIFKGDYDASVPLYRRSELREKYFDLSNPVLARTYYFITRRSEVPNTVSFVGIVHSFSTNVWLCILASLLLTTFLFVSTSKIKFGQLHTEFLNVFINLAVFLFRKGPKITSHSNHTDLLLIIWGLCAVILTATYCGKLSSTMFEFDDHPPPFNDFESLLDCLKSQRCRMIFSDNDGRLLSLMKDPTEKYNQLYKIIKETGYDTTDTVNSSVVKILTSSATVYLGKSECYAMQLQSDSFIMCYEFNIDNRKLTKQLLQLHSFKIICSL